MTDQSNLQDRITFLKDEYQKRQKSCDHFLYSLKDIESIQISANNTPEELVHIEALTARFERMVDIFLNKVIRMIQLCETGLDEGTVRDKLLFCQKLWLVQDPELWLDMRTLRNTIVHDYLYQEHQAFFEIISEISEKELFPSMIAVVEYMKKW